MPGRYNQIENANANIRFSQALMGKTESSRMISTPVHLTTFNAGRLIPIYCREILPDEDLSVSMDFVIRQTTLLTPTMGHMKVDFYAFFVPNRIVNTSWKAVEGENYSGSWTANNVSLAPLKSVSTGTTKIPIGSVADYYGFPTQQAIPNSVLSICNDLKFRGYVFICNEYFRDQNYQPPIPISYLNVYQGFLDPAVAGVPLNGDDIVEITGSTVADGSYGAGSIANELYGSGSLFSDVDTQIAPKSALNSFRATDRPFLVNKLHDYFTSVLPSPQKSLSSVFAPVTGSVNLPQNFVITSANTELTGPHSSLRFRNVDGSVITASHNFILSNLSGEPQGQASYNPGDDATAGSATIYPSNLVTPATRLSVDGLALDIKDIRMASAIQQVYEIMARGGSRYREIVRSFFGIEVDDPYDDIPKCLGHISRDLDLYQTAQTSSSITGGSSTPQGNLAAFGYTSSSGHLFSNKFIEHGYVHIFAVVRQANVYSSYLSRDNFRMSMLDFYTPPLANISEQPVFTREINPFTSSVDNVFGYQEAWAEYRFEPDYVSGYMRPGIVNSAGDSVSLALWNYADDFDSGLQIATGTWLKSNAEDVLNRTLAVTSKDFSGKPTDSPQFKGQFRFIVDKTLPMPTYSVPGMDII